MLEHVPRERILRHTLHYLSISDGACCWWGDGGGGGIFLPVQFTFCSTGICFFSFWFLFLLFAFIICFSRINKENRIVFNSFDCHRVCAPCSHNAFGRERERERGREWGDSFGWKSNFVIHKSIRLRMVVLSRASWPYKIASNMLCAYGWCRHGTHSADRNNKNEVRNKIKMDIGQRIDRALWYVGDVWSNWMPFELINGTGVAMMHWDDEWNEHTVVHKYLN